jgi:hypothetical protein
MKQIISTALASILALALVACDTGKKLAAKIAEQRAENAAVAKSSGPNLGQMTDEEGQMEGQSAEQTEEMASNAAQEETKQWYQQDFRIRYFYSPPDTSVMAGSDMFDYYRTILRKGNVLYEEREKPGEFLFLYFVRMEGDTFVSYVLDPEKKSALRLITTKASSFEAGLRNYLSGEVIGSTDATKKETATFLGTEMHSGVKCNVYKMVPEVDKKKNDEMAALAKFGGEGAKGIFANIKQMQNEAYTKAWLHPDYPDLKMKAFAHIPFMGKTRDVFTLDVKEIHFGNYSTTGIPHATKGQPDSYAIFDISGWKIETAK